MFSQTLEHGNSKNEVDKETEVEGKKRGVNILKDVQLARKKVLTA